LQKEILGFSYLLFLGIERIEALRIWKQIGFEIFIFFPILISVFLGGQKKLSAQEVQELVKGERNVPIIIDFYATWCGPCILMAQELEMVLLNICIMLIMAYSSCNLK
jgi:thiol-disulfide isomerase/thioredoxin